MNKEMCSSQRRELTSISWKLFTHALFFMCILRYIAMCSSHSLRYKDNSLKREKMKYGETSAINCYEKSVFFFPLNLSLRCVCYHPKECLRFAFKKNKLPLSWRPLSQLFSGAHGEVWSSQTLARLHEELLFGTVIQRVPPRWQIACRSKI